MRRLWISLCQPLLKHWGPVSRRARSGNVSHLSGPFLWCGLSMARWSLRLPRHQLSISGRARWVCRSKSVRRPTIRVSCDTPLRPSGHARRRMGSSPAPRRWTTSCSFVWSISSGGDYGRRASTVGSNDDRGGHGSYRLSTSSAQHRQSSSSASGSSWAAVAVSSSSASGDLWQGL